MAKYDLTIENSTVTGNVSRVIIEDYVVITTPDTVPDDWDNDAYIQQMMDWAEFLRNNGS